MLYYGKQPSEGPFRQILSFLNDPASGEQSEVQLGNIATHREISLIEEIFAFDGPPDATVSIGGEDYYYFSGESYLGLQAHPEVLAATCEAVLHYGTSAGSLRRRYTPVPIFDVQRQAAEIYGTDEALYCQSETDALEYVLESVASSYDLVLVDELCGDSALAIIRRVVDQNGLKMATFRHRNANNLKEILERKTRDCAVRPLVVTDGVFNVIGTIAPLPDYYDVLAAYPDAGLLIDDSDAIGVLGEKGRGTLEYYEYRTDEVNRTAQDSQDDPTYGMMGDFSMPGTEDFGDAGEGYEEDEDEDVEDGDDGEPEEDSEEGYGGYDDELDDSDDDQDSMDGSFPTGTGCSKRTAGLSGDSFRSLPVRTYLLASLARGIGGFGCIVPGSASFVDRIRDSARFQLSGYPPTPLAAATFKGLQLSYYKGDIRHKLWNNVYYFKSEMKKLGFSVQENMVPIVAFSTGADQNMRRIQREMIKDQILVSYQRKVNSLCREGTLRAAVFASHERAMLDIFFETLERTL